MQIHKLISKYNFNAGNTGRIKYIVIHYSGSAGTAKNNAEYFASGKRSARLLVRTTLFALKQIILIKLNANQIMYLIFCFMETMYQ